jgi:tetratricopeptide (TPR) repeat protein
MKIKAIILFCSMLLLSICHGQVSERQGNSYTEEEIQKEAERSLVLWNEYMRNDLDSLKEDAYRILLIGIEGKNEFATNVGKRSIGSYLIRTGQHSRGIKYLKQANTYFEKKGDLILQTEVLNEIGNGFLYSGKPVEAEKYYLRSLKCGKESPDPTSSFLAEGNLGQTYINLGNLDKASAVLHHYKNESLKKLKLEAVSSAYAMLGMIEQQKENLALAKEYFRKSAEFGFRSKTKSQIGHAYTNMAIVYFQENDVAASLDYFNKALAIRLQTKNAKSISEGYYNLGDYYYGLEKYDQGLNYYALSRTFSKKKNLLKEEMDAVLAIATLHKTQEKWEKATILMEEYATLQKDYYAELSTKTTEDNEILESLDQMELQNNTESQEAKLLSVIDNQKYHKNVLYGVLAFASLAMLFLAAYRKHIN